MLTNFVLYLSYFVFYKKIEKNFLEFYNFFFQYILFKFNKKSNLI